MPDSPPLTRVHPNEPLVRGLVEAYNAHDADRIAAFYAPDFEGEDVAQAEPQTSPADIRRVTLFYFRAFPELQIDLEDTVFEGDKAVLVWTLRGTQRGTFMRIPPTGRRVAVRGTTIITFKDGLIHRGLRIWDVAGLLRSIGLLPEL
ncbi:MAG: ester cyclase [Anaerolineales bacterium]